MTSRHQDSMARGSGGRGSQRSSLTRCGWPPSTRPSWFHQKTDGEEGSIHLTAHLDFIAGDTLRPWESNPAEPGQMATAVPGHNAQFAWKLDLNHRECLLTETTLSRADLGDRAWRHLYPSLPWMPGSPMSAENAGSLCGVTGKARLGRGGQARMTQEHRTPPLLTRRARSAPGSGLCPGHPWSKLPKDKPSEKSRASTHVSGKFTDDLATSDRNKPANEGCCLSCLRLQQKGSGHQAS